ncbi:MAG TPA: acyl-CoA dehydrogenase C-terminal domain-containing protein [Pseudolabrys sp.]|uniref:acyl-CoA dehydrogenase C-terminal domain-containing protein n=1 Tax=Pseudolabrys sp. TaxID=1960880 RepID=UPI002DDD88E5|nr:acyl-CoA dehydrogenase C-terminal domain-containing protein [Pseudolabrys sp.]HEV2629598.1 acyl-CoA dehydrogenase C-terminal domain-containing protein [Pseudolabrys sp.]
MPTYKAPVDDVLFLVNDVFHLERYGNLPGFAEATSDTVEAILREAAKFSEEVLTPLNRVGDTEGCTRHDDGSVTTPKGFKDAYKQIVEGGWIGISVPEEYGGQGLPATMTVMVNELFCSANMAFAMYPGLTQGAIAALLAHASDELKKTYLPKMTAGTWTGTMNLTEPHCGTDLGLLRSKAVKQADGSYKITGTKIFISAGEHDLSENIIHLVLARIEGAPAGTKGISLFVAPKILVNADGSLGARNAVSCGSIEEKMGIHGNATCVMNYDGATGWLVGEENRGLNAMFTMMNEARLGVGVQGLAQSEVAYQNAAIYAKERLQGRSISGTKYKDKPADPIVVHPDVRRALLTMRAVNEAGRALVLWTALKGDVAHRSDNEKERQAADDHMSLLTPVIKGMLTDMGFQNTVLAQQVFGGHGYIAEHGMEQFVRDSRIAMIYEGANGIQALDLVGRKLAKDGGRAIMAFFNEVQAFLKERADSDAMNVYLKPLGASLAHLQQATMWLMNNAMAKPDNAGAGATDYLNLFGLVALGYMWARIAEAALAKPDEAAMKAKLVTGRFFVERMLPETAAHLARIEAGAGSLMELADAAF